MDTRLTDILRNFSSKIKKILTTQEISADAI